MFKNAIVKTPCKKMVNGLTSANLGKPIYEKALEQHKNYIKALESCGVKVTVLEADENYPDSTFIEDVALCTPHCAIVTSPGADTRKGEIESVKSVLPKFYDNIEFINNPGTLEAGDVMMVRSHYYIGLSDRTNAEGADQLITILNKYDMNGTKVNMSEMLHLKTGLAYLENNNLLVCGEFINKKEFINFNKIVIDERNSYSANSIWVNGNVLIPKGFPDISKKVKGLNYNVIEVDVSEFQKLDGGLSCLSLRF